MTVTNNELFDSYEFELPDIHSNVLVTAVNTTDGTIDISKVGDANSGYALSDLGTFEVGDVYSDNLGTLVGRYVNVGVNSDQELEKLSVKNGTVVNGVMTFHDDTKDYFQDDATKTKYYVSTTQTSNINPTQIISVVDGTDISLAVLAIDEATYSYAKLVLNPNGTIATAVLDADNNAWDGTLKVTTTDGTIVTETKKANLDLDGYTIEKNGEYVTTDAIETADVIFYDSTGDEKFAEVYNNVVTGEPSDVDSTSIKIDGKSYKWKYKVNNFDTFAKYYDEDDAVYKSLGTKTSVDAQKYLASLDAEIGVTAYLDRLGQIVYIDGTVSGTETTDAWYVTTSAGAGYKQALTDYLKFKVSDGTEETIDIPVSQIKSFGGVAGTLAVDTANQPATPAADGSDYTFKFTPTTGATGTITNTVAPNLIRQGVLVKLTRDEDGKVIGIDFPDGYAYTTAQAAYAPITKIDGEVDGNLKNTTKTLSYNTQSSAKLVANSNIWVYSTDTTKAGNPITVTKTAFADYTKTTKALNNPITAYVFVDGGNVSDVLLVETINGAGSNLFKVGDTTKIEGILTGKSEKKKADNTGNYTYQITVLDMDGTKTTYDALDESLPTLTKGAYVAAELDDATGDVATAATGWTGTKYLTPATLANSTATELITDDNTKIDLAEDYAVFKLAGGTYTSVSYTQIITSDKTWSVSWHDEDFNQGTRVHYADFVVVEELDSAAYATAKATIDAAAANTTTLTLDVALGTTSTVANWNTETVDALKVAEPTIATYTITAETPSTFAHTVNADTNAIPVTVTAGGYSKTWNINVTDKSDAWAAAKAAIDGLTTGDITVAALAFNTNETTTNGDLETAVQGLVDAQHPGTTVALTTATYTKQAANLAQGDTLTGYTVTITEAGYTRTMTVSGLSVVLS